MASIGEHGKLAACAVVEGSGNKLGQPLLLSGCSGSDVPVEASRVFRLPPPPPRSRVPVQHRGGHVRSMCQTVAEYIRGTPQPQISNPTCSGARRARVPAGSCVPERETPGAPGRSGVPAQSPDAVPATHTLQGAGSEPPSIGLPLRWEQTLHSTEPRQRIL